MRGVGRAEWERVPMQHRDMTPPEPGSEGVAERYRQLCEAYLNLRKCKKCKLPYNSGFVCLCGWDNSYDYPTPNAGKDE